MTGAQSSYLHTLADQAHQREAAEEDLTKAEASKRIDVLRHDVGLEGWPRWPTRSQKVVFRMGRQSLFMAQLRPILSPSRGGGTVAPGRLQGRPV
jgi:hypothetical protein